MPGRRVPKFLFHAASGCEQAIQRSQVRKLGAEALQFRNGNLGGQVPRQRVLREWASAQPANGRIEAPHSRAIGRRDFSRRIVGTGVQMHA